MDERRDVPDRSGNTDGRESGPRQEPDPEFFLPQMLGHRLMQQPWPRRAEGAASWWNRRVWKVPVWVLLVIGVAVFVALIEFNTPDPAGLQRVGSSLVSML